VISDRLPTRDAAFVDANYLRSSPPAAWSISQADCWAVLVPARLSGSRSACRRTTRSWRPAGRPAACSTASRSGPRARAPRIRSVRRQQTCGSLVAGIAARPGAERIVRAIDRWL